MHIVMQNAHNHNLAIGAVTSCPADGTQPLYSLESGWHLNENSEYGRSFIIIYGREPRGQETDYQLFAWHIPDKKNYVSAKYYQRAITNPEQLDLNASAPIWIKDVLEANPIWTHVPDPKLLPMNVSAKLLKLSIVVRSLYGNDENLFIVSNAFLT